MRALEKSADAVVVKIAIERWKERRAEEQQREQPNHNLRMQARIETSETQRTQQLRWLSYEVNFELPLDCGRKQRERVSRLQLREERRQERAQ